MTILWMWEGHHGPSPIIISWAWDRVCELLVIQSGNCCTRPAFLPSLKQMRNGRMNMSMRRGNAKAGLGDSGYITTPNTKTVTMNAAGINRKDTSRRFRDLPESVSDNRKRYTNHPKSRKLLKIHANDSIDLFIWSPQPFHIQSHPPSPDPKNQ